MSSREMQFKVEFGLTIEPMTKATVYRVTGGNIDERKAAEQVRRRQDLQR
jgi:hypothetical protein